MKSSTLLKAGQTSKFGQVAQVLSGRPWNI